MKPVLFVLAVLLVFETGVSAQLRDHELSEMRKIARIPASNVLRTNSGNSMSSSKPLKVFLAVRMPGNDKKSLEKMAAKWNRGDDAAKHGQLELVDDISKADVVLVEYLGSRSKPVESYSVRLGDPEKPGIGGPVKIGADIENVNGRRYEVFTQPVFSYIIHRDDTLWTVVHAEVESFDKDQQLFDPSLRLWQQFTERVRER